MNFNFVNCLYLFSYYYLIKTTQLQFDWYYLECTIKKTWFLKKKVFLQMNSSYIYIYIYINFFFFFFFFCKYVSICLYSLLLSWTSQHSFILEERERVTRHFKCWNHKNGVSYRNSSEIKYGNTLLHSVSIKWENYSVKWSKRKSNLLHLTLFSLCLRDIIFHINSHFNNVCGSKMKKSFLSNQNKTKCFDA